jgi:cytochrome P450
LDTYEDVRFVMRSDAFAPLRPEDGFGAQFQSRILSDTLLELHGDPHAERRRLESALFETPSLVRYEREILAAALPRALSSVIRPTGPDGVVHGDLLALSTRVLIEVMAALVGIDDLADPERMRRFEQLYLRLDAAARVKYAARDPERILQVGLSALREIVDEFLRPAWDRRERIVRKELAGRLAPEQVPVDLLTLMIQHRDHFAQWDEAVVEREAALYISGTVGTAANELCHAFHEVEAWIESHPEDAGNRMNDRFLGRAVRESVRLHGVNFVLRIASEACVLPSGKQVQPQDVVWLNVRSANEDSFGADGGTFNPYRRPPANRGPYALAFGEGSHACIGRRFALGDTRDSAGSRQGIMVSTLARLYREGMRRDPHRRRTFSDSTVRKQHLTCPIVLGRAEV